MTQFILKVNLVLLFGIICPIIGQAQDSMKINGYVYNSDGETVLYDALIYCVRISDSTLISFTRSQKNGYFELPEMSLDTILLKVMYPGKMEKQYLIVGKTNNLNIHIPKITLQDEDEELPEVVILAYKDPIYFKGDTLIFVADSFDLKKNAVVEDLLKKLPGVSVGQDGKITVNGDKIDRVFVDGDEFFGSDPTFATKNLDAKAIEFVQVYQQSNTITGSDNKENILDLKLKEEAKDNYFGRVSAASDFIKYHEGEFLFNRFKDDRKFSIYGLGSTTPKSQFSASEIKKYGLNNELSQSFAEDGTITIDVKEPFSSSGVPKTISTGFYFTDKFGEKKNIKTTFNYSFNRFELNASATNNSQYILLDSNYYSNNSLNTHLINTNHNFNLVYEHKIDSQKTLINRSYFTINTNSTANYSLTNYYDGNQIPVLQSSFKNEQANNDLNFKNILFYGVRFKKRLRLFSIQYNIEIGNLDGNGTLHNSNSFLIYGTNDSTNQLKQIGIKNFENFLKLKWTEPITQLLRLELSLTGSLEDNQNSNLTFNQTADTQIIDDEFSSEFDRKFKEVTAEVLFKYQTRKLLITLGSKAQTSTIQLFDNYADSLNTYSRSVLLPSFTYTYKRSKADKFEFKYYSHSRLPSSSELQPLRNNSNPNVVFVGNPELIANYNHVFSLQYKFWSFARGNNLSIKAITQFNQNDFSNSTSIDEFGRIVHKRINIEGNQSTVINLNYSHNLKKKILYLTPELSYNHSIYNSVINTVQNSTISNTFRGVIGLSLNLDSLIISIGGGIDYTLPRNSLFPSLNKPYFTIGNDLQVEYSINSRLNFKTDVSFRNIQNKTSGFSIYYFIWNGGVSYNLLKRENLIIAISANDILNQNINVRQIITGNIIADNTTRIISRYFQLKLTYRIIGKEFN